MLTYDLLTKNLNECCFEVKFNRCYISSIKSQLKFHKNSLLHHRVPLSPAF